MQVLFMLNSPELDLTASVSLRQTDLSVSPKAYPRNYEVSEVQLDCRDHQCDDL